MYLDTCTDHEIHILYHAKVKSLYRNTPSPLQTQTVGDLQGQYCNLQSFLSLTINMLRPEGTDVSCVYRILQLCRDTYRISKSRYRYMPTGTHKKYR